MAETKITVLVTEELRRQAEAAATVRGETISEVVRAKLEEYINETEQIGQDPKKALQDDPLLSLRFSGGPGNVAERVQEILAEAANPLTGLDSHE